MNLIEQLIRNLANSVKEIARFLIDFVTTTLASISEKSHSSHNEISGKSIYDYVATSPGFIPMDLSMS